MQSALSIRLGEPSDTFFIVEMMDCAGAGLFAWLLGDAVPSLSSAHLLALAVNEPQSCYFYENALVAEWDGEPCGLMLGFDASRFELPEMARQVVDQNRQAALAPLLASRLEQSFYVNSLAVSPVFARRGVAQALLQAGSVLAATEGLQTISLHVWADNHAARPLYEKLGFAPIGQVALTPWPNCPFAGPMLLMGADTL